MITGALGVVAMVVLAMVVLAVGVVVAMVVLAVGVVVIDLRVRCRSSTLDNKIFA
jgi:hypothetical protein